MLFHLASSQSDDPEPHPCPTILLVVEVGFGVGSFVLPLPLQVPLRFRLLLFYRTLIDFGKVFLYSSSDLLCYCVAFSSIARANISVAQTRPN